jgi:PAS domain S-box-containing protein
LVINARRIEFEPNRQLTLLAIEDVTDKEQQIESNKQQVALIQLAHESIVVREMDGKIRFWNRGAEQMYGWTAKQALGRVTHELLQTRFPKPLADILEELTRTGHWEGELVHTRADGAQRIVSSRWAIQEGKRDAVILEINGDVTERAESEQRLRELSGHLMTLQDEERRRIARELHDSTGQDLVAVELKLGTVVEKYNSIPEIQKAIRESVDLIEKVSRDIRTVAQLLHPPLLDETGLILATKWLIDGFQERGKITIDFKAPADLPRQPENVEIALFRIIQEALTNIYRHSGATRGSVELLQSGDRIELRIRDDGKGMNREAESSPDCNKPTLGVGILGMKERMKQLGGTLEIESGRQGTLVRASLRRP